MGRSRGHWMASAALAIASLVFSMGGLTAALLCRVIPPVNTSFPATFQESERVWRSWFWVFPVLSLPFSLTMYAQIVVGRPLPAWNRWLSQARPSAFELKTSILGVSLVLTIISTSMLCYAIVLSGVERATDSHTFPGLSITLPLAAVTSAHLASQMFHLWWRAERSSAHASAGRDTHSSST